MRQHGLSSRSSRYTVENAVEAFRLDGGSVIWVSHTEEQRKRVAIRTLTITGGALKELSP